MVCVYRRGCFQEGLLSKGAILQVTLAMVYLNSKLFIDFWYYTESHVYSRTGLVKTVYDLQVYSELLIVYVNYKMNII